MTSEWAKYFYVSAVNGKRRHFVAGPYDSVTDAERAVAGVRRRAEEIDPRAAFMAWGTAGSDTEIKTPLGTFGGTPS